MIKIEGIQALRTAAAVFADLPAANRRAMYRAVNSVANKTGTQARRDIGAQINLTQSYIREQMSITGATIDHPKATIRARKRPVRLARFDARQLTRAAKGAKGDPRRGIAPGRKQAGVGTRILRGGKRSTSRKGFLVPLRNGNGMGVFVRTGRGPGAIKHKYGPSPDQVFRRWKTESLPDIKSQLAAAYASQLKYELKGSRR